MVSTKLADPAVARVHELERFGEPAALLRAEPWQHRCEIGVVLLTRVLTTYRERRAA